MLWHCLRVQRGKTLLSLWTLAGLLLARSLHEGLRKGMDQPLLALSLAAQ